MSDTLKEQNVATESTDNDPVRSFRRDLQRSTLLILLNPILELDAALRMQAV